MTTAKEDKDFKDAMIDNDLLEKAIEWIGNHIEPDEVFSEDQLEKWAHDNGMEFIAGH